MNATSDPIADFLNRIKNGYAAGKAEIPAPFSTLKLEIARILKQEGYIWDYEVKTEGKKAEIIVKAKYVSKEPAIRSIKRVSKPGLRHYVGSQEIPKVLGGLGISILSTSSGIMTGREARRKNVGGELLAYVW